jgi:hypothetical protein
VNLFPRRIIAGLICVIFLMITISPLAAITMRFATVAHAVSGVCTGDCDTCECAPERRASHTCCCWYNKLKRHDSHNKQQADCCMKTKSNKTATMTSTCPCGSGKQLALCNAEEMQYMPYRSAMEIPVPHGDTLSHNVPARLAGRNGEPPDPPPKIYSL